MTIKLFNTLFLAAYLLSALAQYNDPDALRWIIIYLAAAAMCVAAYRDSGSRPIAIALLLASLTWAAVLLPSLGGASLTDIFESVSMKTKAVEEAREIGGLCFVAVWAAVLSFRHSR
ncbi:MAG: hypothetical protein ACI9NT_001536 [Bacteroidia bacterium]|jgi:hypothetical protein